MTTEPAADVDRFPLAHSVRYVARGLPEEPNKYGPGVLAPSEITLTYRAAPDSQLGRVHAYVAGRLWVDGVEVPLLPGGLYGQHYDDGLDDWPEWLAVEARLHDPAAVPVPPPTDQTAVARVRALHQQYRFAGDDTTDYCAHCNQISGGWIPWPCPTVQALTADEQPAVAPCVAAETPQTETQDAPAVVAQPGKETDAGAPDGEQP
jgi:hypothetical protein